MLTLASQAVVLYAYSSFSGGTVAFTLVSQVVLYTYNSIAGGTVYLHHHRSWYCILTLILQVILSPYCSITGGGTLSLLLRATLAQLGDASGRMVDLMN